MSLVRSKIYKLDSISSSMGGNGTLSLKDIDSAVFNVVDLALQSGSL